MKKRWISLCLALTCCISMFPLNTQAVQVDGGGRKYKTLNGTTYTSTGDTIQSVDYYVKDFKAYASVTLGTGARDNETNKQVYVALVSESDLVMKLGSSINSAIEKTPEEITSPELWMTYYPSAFGTATGKYYGADNNTVQVAVQQYWEGQGGDAANITKPTAQGAAIDQLPMATYDVEADGAEYQALNQISTRAASRGCEEISVTRAPRYRMMVWYRFTASNDVFITEPFEIDENGNSVTEGDEDKLPMPGDPTANTQYFHGITIGDVTPQAKQIGTTDPAEYEEVDWTWHKDTDLKKEIYVSEGNPNSDTPYTAVSAATAVFAAGTREVYPVITKGDIELTKTPIYAVKPGTKVGELDSQEILKAITAKDKNAPEEFVVNGSVLFDLADDITLDTELLQGDNPITTLPIVFTPIDGKNYNTGKGSVIFSNADIAVLMGDGTKTYDPNNAMQYPNLEVYYIGGLAPEQEAELEAAKATEEAYATAVKNVGKEIRNDGETPAYTYQWYQGAGIPDTDEGKAELARTEPTVAGPQTVLVTFAENGTYPEGATYQNCGPIAVGDYSIAPAIITSVGKLPDAKTIYASNASNQTVEKLNEYIKNLTNPDYKEDAADPQVFNTVEVTLKPEDVQPDPTPEPSPEPTASEEIQEGEPVIEPLADASEEPIVAAAETPEAPTEEPPVVEPTPAEPITAQVAIETVKDRPAEAKLQASISADDATIGKLKYDIKGKTYTVYMPLVLNVNGDDYPEFEYDKSLTSEETTERIANEGQYAARSLEIKPVHLKVPTVEDPLPMMLALHAQDEGESATPNQVTLSKNLTDLGYDVEPEGDDMGKPVKYSYEWKQTGSEVEDTFVSTADAARIEYSGTATVQRNTIPQWVSAPDGHTDLVYDKQSDATATISNFARRIEIVDATLELNRTLDTASQAELKASVQSGTFKDVTFTVTLPKAASKDAKPTLVPCDAKGAETGAADAALAAENFFGSKLADSDFVLKSATDEPNEAGDRVITATFGMPVPDPDAEPAVAQKYVQPGIDKTTDLLASSLKYTKTVTDVELADLFADGAVSIELAYSDSNKLLLTPTVTGSVGKTLKLTMESYDPKKQADYILTRLDTATGEYQKDKSFTMDRQVMKSWVSDADETTERWTGNGKGTGKYTQSPEITMIPAGTYKLEVRKPGHTPIVIEGIEITGAENEAIDVLALYNADTNTSKTEGITSFRMIPGDINGDGVIRVDDRNLAASGRAFGQKVDYKTAKSTDLAYICDLDGDGYVRLNDLDMITNPASLGKLLKSYQITKEIAPVVESSSVLDLADDLSNMLMESMTPGT